MIYLCQLQADLLTLPPTNGSQLFFITAGSQHDCAVPGSHCGMTQHVWSIFCDDSHHTLQHQRSCFKVGSTTKSGRNSCSCQSALHQRKVITGTQHIWSVPGHDRHYTLHPTLQQLPQHQHHQQNHHLLNRLYMQLLSAGCQHDHQLGEGKPVSQEQSVLLY